MPKILEKQKVLGGRGLVFTYENDNVGTYFYREKIDGTKKYRLKKRAKKISLMAILLVILPSVMLLIV